MPYLFLYPATGGAAPVADYKWTNDFTYSSGSGPGDPISVIGADIGGVDLTQSILSPQPIDGGGFATFDGNNDFVEDLPDVNAGDFTYLMKVNQASRGDAILGVAGASGTVVLIIDDASTDRVRLRTAANVLRDFEFLVNTPLSTDMTVTLRRESNLYSLFLDTEKSLNTFSDSGAFSPDVFGKRGGGTPNAFDGDLHDFRLFTRALSDAEVLTVYNDMNP